MGLQVFDTVRRIQAVLSPELLKPEWRKLPNRHPLAGHCYVASEAVYWALGGKAAGLTPHSAPCPGGTHWWLVDAAGAVIDPTAEQFDATTRAAIYAAGQGRGFLTPGPSARAMRALKLAGLAPTVRT